MKKKEKDHLKADPFVHFFETAITFFKHNRRTITMAAAGAGLVVLILLAAFLFSRLSSAGENKLYNQAFRIQTDANLTVDQKIARLREMKFRNGISASGRLFIAGLCFEKGDLAGAGAALDAMPRSRVALLNDEKLLLRAQVFAAGGKTADAEALLNRMLSDRKTVVAGEAVLLQLARLQIKGGRGEEAASTLKRILSEHPNTPGAMEAQSLLATVAGGGDAAR